MWVRPLPRRPLADSARAAAFAVLEAVESRGGSSNTLLAEIDLPDDRERHLATSLVYGVLRQRRGPEPPPLENPHPPPPRGEPAPAPAPPPAPLPTPFLPR